MGVPAFGETVVLARTNDASRSGISSKLTDASDPATICDWTRRLFSFETKAEFEWLI